jgi:hypothetical protein
MIALVHLVWGPFGPSPLRSFLSSYRRHHAGVEHELVLLFNGVSPEQRGALQAAAGELAHRPIELDTPVQDLAAYAHAAARLEHERVCFLNSYSAVLADGWLAKLDHALDQPGAGIVGATGSWASLRSGALNALLLPNAYRAVVPKRSVARTELAAMEREAEQLDARTGAAAPAERGDATPPVRTVVSSVASTLKGLAPMPEQLLRFDGFPNPHLRTNAFMVQRTLFASLRVGRLRRKMDAYVLESGRHSFTRQVQRRGLRALVVDRRGTCWEPDHWHRSRTLWQGDQEELLVADNQTRLYSNGGLQRRRLLSAFAWGQHADPSPPRAEVASDGDRDG